MRHAPPRLLVGLLLLAGLAFSSAPVMAVPTAGLLTVAETSFDQVGQANRRLQWRVLLQRSESSPAPTTELVLELTPCTGTVCAATQRFAKAVTTAEASLDRDLNEASVSLVAMGRQLTFSWSPSGPFVVHGTTQLFSPVLPTGKARVTVQRERMSAVSVSVGATRCRITGGRMANEAVVDGTDPAASSQIPAQTPTVVKWLGTSLRCG